jgi:predicted trehalose synthase
MISLRVFLHGDFSIYRFVFEQELLAHRTAEMHLALAVDTESAEFAPEPYTDEYRSWLLKHLEHLVKVRMKMIELKANIGSMKMISAWLSHSFSRAETGA